MEQHEAFLEKARALEPRLYRQKYKVSTKDVPLKKGESVCVDFGKHLVGYVSIKLSSVGSHPDAPAWIRLTFAERESEFAENTESYQGWISASWVQQEQLHVDILPSVVALPRRYAFRYVRLEVLDVSSKYALVPQAFICDAISSANDETLISYKAKDGELQKIDEVACRTLHDCMQSVFEDGPKRDRRLWIGDLRLQALANYETYQNNNLVKRCLYLFAGSTFADGRVAAGMFIEPEIEADDTAMFDYSLFFIPTLRDYWQATGDTVALRELWPTAWRQIELAQAQFDETGLINDSDKLGWCFLDWCLSLNKQAGAQGVYLYCLKAAQEIAEYLNDEKALVFIKADREKKKDAALKYLYDEQSSLFVSGNIRQVSWASQIWLILGGAVSPAQGAQILAHIEERKDAVEMVTPYLYHHYIEALLSVGEKEKALQVLKGYWGGMIQQGADTFWELYNPQNPDESPYGGTIVNSFCHAWSCAPAYFLRKYYSVPN